MTVDEAEKLLVKSVKEQGHGMGLRVEEIDGKRPSFRVVGTRVGTMGEEGRYVIVMKRVSQNSVKIRDDFDQLFDAGLNSRDLVALEAIRSFRREIVKIVPKAKCDLVGGTANKDLPRGSVERELKTAVHFEIVAAAKRVDAVVAALVGLAQALR